LGAWGEGGIPFLEVADVFCVSLREVYHLDEEVGEGGAGELGVLAAVEVAVVDCLLVGGVAEAGAAGLGAAHCGGGLCGRGGRRGSVIGIDAVVVIVSFDAED
jgi:hypothetical protein